RCAGVPHSLYRASLLCISWVNTSHTARTHNPPPISGSMQISFIDHIFTSTKRASAKRQISACFKISRLRQPLRRLVVSQQRKPNISIHALQPPLVQSSCPLPACCLGWSCPCPQNAASYTPSLSQICGVDPSYFCPCS